LLINAAGKPAALEKGPKNGETPKRGVSHEGDGEVGRMFYRRPGTPACPPFE
jgi:hypothetical protein